MVSLAKRKFVENILANIAYGGFTPHLGIFTAELVSHIEGITTFGYKIPSSLCREGKNGPYLSTSATIALFDEFSSISTIITDKNTRPGVYIVLSAENYVDTPPNTEVRIVSNALKIGKTIGFSEIQMLDLNGNLLASGSHIKFLEMGKWWDIMMHPSIFPQVVNVLDSPFVKKVLLSQRIYYPPPLPLCDQNKIGSMYSTFKLSQSSPSLFEIDVDPRHMNPNKAFHGGAVAISTEESLLLANKGFL
jgi:acyl-coenzyme A thioesterase PaaI-like protein